MQFEKESSASSGECGTCPSKRPADGCNLRVELCSGIGYNAIHTIQLLCQMLLSGSESHCLAALYVWGFFRVRGCRQITRVMLTGAVISNHCSYLDILVLMSRYFPSFVARSNTAEMPLLGVCRSVSSLNLLFEPEPYCEFQFFGTYRVCKVARLHINNVVMLCLNSFSEKENYCHV